MSRGKKRRKVVGLAPFVTLLIVFVAVLVSSIFLVQAKSNELNKVNELLKIEQDKSIQLESNVNELKKQNEDITKQLEDLKNELEELKVSKLNNKDMPTDKVAYLTFDDGPSDNTLRILDVLKEHNVKATFFVIGNPNRMDVYKRIVDEGHTIGNHTYSHDYNSIYKSTDAFFADVEKLNDLIEEATGQRTKILRFPGGSNNTVSRRAGGKDIMNLMTKAASDGGYKFHDWNVDSQDASKAKQSKDIIVSSVINGAKYNNHSMILMHDAPAKTTTVDALPDIIKGLSSQGFKFKRIEMDTKEVQF